MVVHSEGASVALLTVMYFWRLLRFAHVARSVKLSNQQVHFKVIEGHFNRLHRALTATAETVERLLFMSVHSNCTLFSAAAVVSSLGTIIIIWSVRTNVMLRVETRCAKHIFPCQRGRTHVVRLPEFDGTLGPFDILLLWSIVSLSSRPSFSMIRSFHRLLVYIEKRNRLRHRHNVLARRDLGSLFFFIDSVRVVMHHVPIGVT